MVEYEEFFTPSASGSSRSSPQSFYPTTTRGPRQLYGKKIRGPIFDSGDLRATHVRDDAGFLEPQSGPGLGKQPIVGRIKPMLYFSEGSLTGWVRFHQLPSYIGVTDQAGDHVLIGSASEVGLTQVTKRIMIIGCRH
jgi:hypothetical protein